jgi:6-methylsalicylate decarboxylase
MNDNSIAKSVLSITSPGTNLKLNDRDLARQLTMQSNDEIAEICRKQPDRFGFFASLPLPDIQGSIAEIDRALDKLGAFGFAIMTNSHGYYAGDPELDEVFAKFDERRAIVFMHPTSCCSQQSPQATRPLSKYPAPMMEFFFDTTRAVINLILSGTVKRYPNITFLVSHCGATLPTLLERFTAFSSAILKEGSGVTAADVKDLLSSRFYFDLAGFPWPDQIHGLLRITNASRLLYGSDFPYTPASAIKSMGITMDKGLNQLFDSETVKNVYAGNARSLAKKHDSKI